MIIRKFYEIRSDGVNMACVWLTLIMTANKALGTVSYTRNSATEKLILGFLDKTQMELSLKSVTAKRKTEDSLADDKEEEGNG